MTTLANSISLGWGVQPPPTVSLGKRRNYSDDEDDEDRQHGSSVKRHHASYHPPSSKPFPTNAAPPTELRYFHNPQTMKTVYTFPSSLQLPPTPPESTGLKAWEWDSSDCLMDCASPVYGGDVEGVGWLPTVEIGKADGGSGMDVDQQQAEQPVQRHVGVERDGRRMEWEGGRAWSVEEIKDNALELLSTATFDLTDGMRAGKKEALYPGGRTRAAMMARLMPSKIFPEKLDVALNP
ncbi:hypothetical protein HDV05_004539 [Chytridiales sp. JEL 0842]|nr:hypothetical protein HDV05_004539 [Chytridiales sp. JEL 0842]